MKIYVVTDGFYSSYHIEAVFTDKARAERFSLVHRLLNARKSGDSSMNEERAKGYGP